MPLTFIDIERQKNWRIAAFFVVLLLIYLAATVLLASAFLGISFTAGYRLWTPLAVIALGAAAVHFWFSASDTVADVSRELSAQKPDPQDEVHKMLRNIMEEVHVVTGNRRKIGCFVIPSLSLNALAVADLKGNASIGITEGLLSRLSRSQLETVIAHEAHHILSGDCLETTVAASIFGTYASIMERLNVSRGRAFSSPAFLLAWVLLQLSTVLNFFISREREYRADAASVRMTRNPVALAETLHLLSRSWRGAGFIGSGFEMLCIVNPKAMALDETEGFWADLLSTHPPISKRIRVLLDMARVSITELEARKGKNRTGSVPADGPGFYALSPQHAWQGPFSLAELSGLPWLTPLTWITTGKEQPVDRAWKDPAVNALLALRLRNGDTKVSDYICPVCNQRLALSSYEGTRIYRCRFCAGTLVENARIPRIIARTGRDGECTARINALARSVVKQNHSRQAMPARRTRKMVLLLACPRCRNSMMRGFYSQAHLIEVDRCGACGLTWFDQDELAMLQCLIENRILPEDNIIVMTSQGMA